MSVYVDSLMQHGWKLGKSCHLIADSIDELKEFAKRIGLKESWFQPKSSPHFDLTESRRIAAIKAGAIELDRKQFVEKLKEIRGKK